MFASPGRLLTPTLAPGGVSPEAAAVIAAMVPTPDAARQAAIAALVQGLLDSGTWSKIGALYVFAAHSAQASLLDWKAPSGTPAVANDGPTFTADYGYTGAGGTAHIDTQRLYSAIPGLAQNNAHAGALATYTGGSSTVIGNAGGSAGATLRLGTSANLTIRMNNSAESTSVGAYSFASHHHFLGSRNNSANHDSYVDGNPAGTFSQVSAVPAISNWTSLRHGGTYAGAAVRVHAMHAGSYLTATEADAVAAALMIYAAALAIP